MPRNHPFLRELRKLFDLRGDMNTPEEIEAGITQGARVYGTNLWILMFAIFVASIGLNVNSTAVIIGAMLISPLMGPIMGIGYGAGIDNFALIRQSFRSLGVFILLSLLTSTLYFLLTPLDQAQSELLARTTPTLWDLLIALFGGMAGIIAATRKEKGNVIPGVAIATALMPPLCTAGYGLATGQPRFFFGAFYLFTINAVYIALSALLFTRLLRLPRYSSPSEGEQKRTHLVITLAILVTIVPSLYLAIQLVQHEVFKTQANTFLTAVTRAERGLFVIQRDINPETSEITLTLASKHPDPATLARLHAQLGEFGLQRATLTVHAFSPDEGGELDRIKAEMQQDLNRNILTVLDSKNAQIQALEARLREQEASQASKSALLDVDRQVAAEIMAQYPEFRNVLIAHGQRAVPSTRQAAQTTPPTPHPKTLIVYLESRQGLSASTKTRIRNWLKTRYQLDDVIVTSKLN